MPEVIDVEIGLESSCDDVVPLSNLKGIRLDDEVTTLADILVIVLTQNVGD